MGSTKINWVGMEINNITCIEETDGKHIKVRCSVCKSEFICLKRSFKLKIQHCKNYKCKNSLKQELRGVEKRGLVCLEEINALHVKLQCKHCGQIDTYMKQAFREDRVNCKNKKCSNSIRKQIIGTTKNNLKIIDDDGTYVTAVCNICGKTDKYSKTNFNYKTPYCSNENCSNTAKVKWVGMRSKGLICTKAVDHKHILAKCETCGNVEEYNKTAFTKGQVTCKDAECKNSVGKVNWINMVRRDITCVKEVDKENLTGRCNKCGNESEYSKSAFKIGNASCKNINCNNSRFVNWETLESGNIKFIKRLEKKKVVGRCNICGEEGNYYDSAFRGNKITCKNEKCINNISNSSYLRKTEQFEIVGAVKDSNVVLLNFTCKQCGFNDYLTKEQCIKHLEGHKH